MLFCSTHPVNLKKKVWQRKDKISKQLQVSCYYGHLKLSFLFRGKVGFPEVHGHTCFKCTFSPMQGLWWFMEGQEQL